MSDPLGSGAASFPGRGDIELLLDDKRLRILEILSDSSEPIGSWNLVELLEGRGVSVSPATIGRTLNRLESLGYLEKEKFKGRVITPKGVEAIRLSQELRERNYYKEQLDAIINTNVLQNFLMVLEARKAIERSTVRLAAERANEADVRYMDEILERQKALRDKGCSIADEDRAFHKAIAAASGNKALEILYAIISMSGQQSRLFEHLRKKVASPCVTGHLRILEAIRDHKPDRAEICMVEHLDGLIEDVNTYWHLYHPK